MNPNPVNNSNLSLHTIVPTFVPNSTIRPASMNTAINLFTNISNGTISSNTNNNNNGSNQSASSRLKVEDALSYLDRVKSQFTHQPQVYNQFLDIMKEFKSQTIDTQEVINRVSTLFHGHPDLIFGFNTFLPPGYKIEITDDQPGYISVTHPMSNNESVTLGNLNSTPTYTYSITTPTATIVRQSSYIINHTLEETHVKSEPSVPSNNSTAQAVNALISAANAPQSSYLNNNIMPSSTSKSTKQSTSNSNTAAPTSSTPSGQPVEFNHAINYVNKIKNRFHQNPNVYKTFLEILYAYQKQQRTPKESVTVSTIVENGETQGSVLLSETEVYAKVAQLFVNHDDLLAEFSQFLPDASQKSSDRSSSSSSSQITSPEVSRTPTTVNQTGLSTNCERNSGTSYTIITPNSLATNRDPTMSPKRIPSSTENILGNYKRPSSSSKSPTITKKKRSSIKNDSTSQTEVNGRDIPGEFIQGLPSMDELEFFDKVQKTLRSPAVFDNFLRCILLYTKQIISRVELFGLIHNYLGHAPELLRKFQEMINLREPGEIIIPQSIHDQTDTDSMITIDYGSCSQYGKSYRLIPRSYVPPVCSGRTQLCKDVLNDHCVLFPTFTDESSSVTTKKSVFEEHMFKIEDERFELDIVMEVNLSAIRALEKVQNHINSLPIEQQNSFQLDDQLGGESAFTQRQAVQRIYGERANEIIDGLKRNPRVAVPIVLKRLKSKDEEWKESKKNFERFWKEQSEKYYLKSLDYMGINCKNSDARIIRTRHLLNEIESIKDEHDQQSTANNHQPHLVLSYEDPSIIDDAASLLNYFLKRQTSFSREDRQNMKKMIYQFLPDFFFATSSELSDEDDDIDNDDNEPNGKREKKSRSTRQNESNRKRNIELSTVKPRPVIQKHQNSNDMFHLFFANDNYYYFFRLHQLLYERLSKISQQSTRLIEQETRDSRENSFQRSRSSTSTTNTTRPTVRQTTSVDEYYPSFLEMVRQLIDSTLDSATYEDTLREMFGIHAYLAFTLDKIIYNCVRQLHAIVADQSSESIMKLYVNSKGTQGLVDDLYSVEQQNSEAIYQHQMEPYTDANRLFRLCSYKNDRRLTISLILIDSSEEDDEDNEEEKEKICENATDYVESYVQTNQVDVDERFTNHLKARLKNQPAFLHRNLFTAQETNIQRVSDTVVVDNDYCHVDGKTLRRTATHRAGFLIYRRGSFGRTKAHHRKATMKQFERFSKLYEDWSDKSLNIHADDDKLIQNIWRETHRSTINDQHPLTIESVLSNCDEDLRRPPYRHVRQYHLTDEEK